MKIGSGKEGWYRIHNVAGTGQAASLGSIIGFRLGTRVEGLRDHIAIDGSLSGVSGKIRWLGVVQLDF